MKVAVKKVKKCVECGRLFDGESCGCGCKEYADAYVLVGGG